MKTIIAKKGMTIMEILVSIVLISLVILFLMVLITDVNTDSNLSKSRLIADTKRSEFVTTVQDRLRGYDADVGTYFLKSVESSTTGLASYRLTFTFKNRSNGHENTIEINVTNQNIEYIDTVSGENPISEKWPLALNGAKYKEPVFCVINTTGALNETMFIKYVIPVDFTGTTYEGIKLNMDIELTYYVNYLTKDDNLSSDALTIVGESPSVACTGS